MVKKTVSVLRNIIAICKAECNAQCDITENTPTADSYWRVSSRFSGEEYLLTHFELHRMKDLLWNTFFCRL